MSQKTLLTVVGPTAIGKTSLAIALAQHYGTEILSADSRQFYKEMRIGTAVPSHKELTLAPHHFIQHQNIHSPYSVGDFERDALSLLDHLFKVKNVVVLVGGSGLYVDAVTRGLDHFPKVSPEIRERLNALLGKAGIEALQERLLQMDPDYYAKVDKGNPHRLIRALEICEGTGRPYSSFIGKGKRKRPFHTLLVGLRAERKTIYERIELRVDQMIRDGLLEEARDLYPYRHLNALNTVGYKELFQYFDGNCSREEAILEIKKNTRRFAKRQLTWYRKNEKILWVPHDAPQGDILSRIASQLATHHKTSQGKP